MSDAHLIGGDSEVHFTGGVPQLVSPPQNVVFYWVQLHQLEQLMRVERPMSLGVACAAGGAAIGLLPIIGEARSKLSADQYRSNQS